MSAGGGDAKCGRCGFNEAYSHRGSGDLVEFFSCPNCGHNGSSDVEGFFNHSEGSWFIRQKNGECRYSYIKIFRDTAPEYFKKLLEDNKDWLDASESYLNQWKDGKVIHWVGNGPTLEGDHV